ncbi:MAG: outer membrane beta-barrel protein [Bdellovibrionales bacterium]|nr:outer membrane beta-barrel protein [Bdellovibrionales bacterium]
MVLRKAAQLLSLCLVLAGVAAHSSWAAADQYRLLEGTRLAQFDADDAYDPFADYSEFEEAQEEEADINFFRNGRFVTLGFIGGMRGWTGGLSEMYRTSPTFGLFLSYFFDLRFALQFSFNTGDHAFSVKSKSGTVANGNIGITNFALDVKYYVNTQNVTKGLAKFNPYMIAGFSRVDRTTNIEGVEGFGKEGAMAFDLGAGIELPMMRNKMFFGAQAMYQMVNFHDENTEVEFIDNSRTGKYPNGDSYTLMAIIGVNF